MDFLKNTALGLIAAAAAGTLATVIVPRGSMDKTLRAVVGIFVVAVICSPFAQISETELIDGAFVKSDEILSDDSYTAEMQEKMIGFFNSEIDSNVKEIASELNINVVSVNSEITVDENHCINIHKIVVNISDCETSAKESLSVKISENLGVPAEVIAE